MKNTDLGNPAKPKRRDKIDKEIKEPKDEAFNILIKSDRLVYRHIPLYNPKIKKEDNLEIKITGK
tara:strand:+ start:160 stop:354 length:195 start_codon:yes stop_codon:yes gene_type:complete